MIFYPALLAFCYIVGFRIFFTTFFQQSIWLSTHYYLFEVSPIVNEDTCISINPVYFKHLILCCWHRYKHSWCFPRCSNRGVHQYLYLYHLVLGICSLALKVVKVLLIGESFSLMMLNLRFVPSFFNFSVSFKCSLTLARSSCWSPPTSAPRFTTAFAGECLYRPLMMIWSIWLWFFPLGEIQVVL